MKSPMKFRLLLACMLFLGLIGPAAITYPAAPEGGKEAALQSLSHALKPFRVDRVEDLAISAPCQIYRVELTNLAAGETGRDTARLFGLTAGRISQLRGELKRNWQTFQGEIPEAGELALAGC